MNDTLGWFKTYVHTNALTEHFHEEDNVKFIARENAKALSESGFVQVCSYCGQTFPQPINLEIPTQEKTLSQSTQWACIHKPQSCPLLHLQICAASYDFINRIDDIELSLGLRQLIESQTGW